MLSRYCYAKPLPQEINPNTLKKVFNELFDEGMPKFNILKSDADPSLLKIKGFLSEKSVFLFVKRGRRKLGLLDAYQKHIKTKIITYLKIHPEADFPSLLKAVIKSQNNTFSQVLKGTPSEFNSNYFDPLLRKRLYKNHSALQPFETWYKEQLNLQRKAFQPRLKNLKNRDDFCVSDLVFVLFRKPYLQRNWSRQNTHQLYRIERVHTAHGKPYSYQLRDVMTNEIVPGYFAGSVSFSIVLFLDF